jgi:DNA-binding transcriptional LysR family regulator
MDIDTSTFQCFIAVAETSSFTRAAEQIGRTQSAVSQQVTKLEKGLARKLFLRDKTLQLTPEGEIFLRYARQIITLHRELMDYLNEPELSGELHFGLSEDFASVMLSNVLSEFTKIHPRVFLHTACDLTLNLCDRYNDGEFDLVMVKINKTRKLKYSKEIWSEKLLWVGNTDLIDFSRAIPLVLSPEPCVYRAHALEMLEKMNIRWRLAFTSTSHASTLEATKAGLGLTVLPQSLIPEGYNIAMSDKLPQLHDTHISIVKREKDNPLFNAFESFVARRFHQH